MNGSIGVVSGTSASSPVFGGMVALVNAKRLAAGKSTLGWINPSLYALASSFVKDITSGNNHCSVYGKTCCAQGFTTTVGWDPVTGLGSLNYTKFESVFFALGDAPNIPSASPSVVPGSPSVALVSRPTGVPVLSPTSAPSTNAGWIYGSYFSDSDCSGEVPKVEGWKIGTCFTGYSGDTPTIYFKYSCDSGETHSLALDFVDCLVVHAYLTEYSDSSCTQKLLVNSLFLGCSPSDQYYYYGDSYSYSLSCSTSTSKPLDDSVTYALLT